MMSCMMFQTLFNPNKTVVKMFVVMYDLREMPAGHQTFLRQRTFSVPVKRESNGLNHRKPLPPGQGRTLRYLIHLRWAHLYRFDVLLVVCVILLSLILPHLSPSGSRAPNLERSTSIETSGFCSHANPWKWTVVLPTSSNPSPSLQPILLSPRDADQITSCLMMCSHCSTGALLKSDLTHTHRQSLFVFFSLFLFLHPSVSLFLSL